MSIEMHLLLHKISFVDYSLKKTSANFFVEYVVEIFLLHFHCFNRQMSKFSNSFVKWNWDMTGLD